MSDDAVANTMALVPHRMQAYMEELEVAAPGYLRCFTSVEELVHDSTEKLYAVALIPATGFSPEEWWSIWGFLNDMEPRPSILVYALRSDFEMWSSVLDSGGFDVIVAPFTAMKLRMAITSAAAEFLRMTEG
jgi:hypothetical protein